MSLFDSLRRQTYQRRTPEPERTQHVREAIIQLTAEGKDIEGILAIFIKNGRIYVMEGGLQDDFEAQVFLRRAEYLINRQGLVTQ